MTEGLAFYRSEDHGQTWVTVPFDEVRPPVYETTFYECMQTGSGGSQRNGMWVHPSEADVLVFGRGAWGKYIDGRLEITLFRSGCDGTIWDQSLLIPLAAPDIPTGFRLAADYSVAWLANIPTPQAPIPDFRHTERPRAVPARIRDAYSDDAPHFARIGAPLRSDWCPTSSESVAHIVGICRRPCEAACSFHTEVRDAKTRGLFMLHYYPWGCF